MLQAPKRQDSIRALYERLGPMQFEVPGVKFSNLKHSALQFAPLGKWQFDFAVTERKHLRAPLWTRWEGSISQVAFDVLLCASTVMFKREFAFQRIFRNKLSS